MTRRRSQLILSTVCFILGLLLVMQFRTQTRLTNAVTSLPANEQWSYASSLTEANQKLRGEVTQLRTQLDAYESAIGKGELDKVADDLVRLRMVSGELPVQGPGIEITISGKLRPSGGLSPEELNDVTNELRNSGCEAIAINGNRVVVSSSFSRSPEGIVMDGSNLLVAPYVIEAIGAADLLEPALMRQGGQLYLLQGLYPEARISLYRKTELTLARRDQTLQFQYAQVVEE